MIGTSLRHYRIVEKIGEGGMGVVYRALDTHLDRTVAIKVLRPEAVGDAERKWRFVREAKAASALNHPHIVTIHDIDSDQGVDFMVMELVDGTPLDRLIPKEGLPVAQALDYGAQIASALGAAHAAGIVHRDVKPANVIVCSDGRVKVLDFGLAKLVERGSAGAQTTDSTATAETALPRTRDGVILGTVAYMSPEQAQGNPVDARSDVFSFGSVLYEMLAGRRPFEGDSQLQTLASILRDPPAPLASVRRDVPPDLENIVRRSLEKHPEDRYPTAQEMATELSAAHRRGAPAAVPVSRPAWLRPAVLYPAIAVLAAGIVFATFSLVRASRVRRAKTVELPEIARLLEQQKPAAAFRLARAAARYLPQDVARLRADWLPATITTESPGADALMRDYLSTDADWQPMGKTPLHLRLPQGYYRWKFSKPGYAPVDATGYLNVSRRLDSVSTVPAGMVRVAGGAFSLQSLNPVSLEDFWIDKYEVTNREFKAFVDAGGYSKREYWKQPFVRDGREIPWAEAAARFRDGTGRPGPSTWELGTYPEGRGDFPVDGVSWYEAAAYAEFAGKSLPTVYHWYRAAGMGAGTEIFSEILRVSNFGGKGPWAIGTGQGMGPFGTYDQAGNVKEWCLNATGGRRYLLGGSWSEPIYMFRESDAQDSFGRAPGYGFRCARYMSAPAAVLSEPIPRLSRDYAKETPVSDDVFRAYKSLYEYDRGPLDVRVEAEEDFPYWRRQRVSILAAYGNERVPIFLFLPKNSKPPYQTVVYFPNSWAQLVPSSADLDVRNIEYVVRSGRAVIHPIYKETYERITEARSPSGGIGPNQRRDLVIQWSKDLGRSLDYLETRPDIDRSKLAYYGSSLGAIDGVVLVAMEPRFRTAIFLAGGFRLAHVPSEVEPINFAPRIHIPVLLVAGRYDFAHPYETAQVPLFRMLGTPEQDKKHYVFEGGHAAPKNQPIIKEVLDWLDRYLGPVG
jgi:formylglycine-generating enzyme required for sulfatase activity/tRNA A-37 threonylcarbamoyl transferase component Bud32/dienelactone hydrolase